MRPEHRPVDLRHLRAFAAIVDAGGFARAAIRLNLSQPGLSRQIAALEEDLGVPLFDRLGRRALLTSEGEDLLRRSRRLLSDAESLGERARALKGGLTGLLRVGATPQAMETLLAGFLARYRRRRPGVEVHLIEDGVHAFRCASSMATSTWRSSPPETRGSGGGCSGPCICWPCCRPRTAGAGARCSRSRISPISRC